MFFYIHTSFHVPVNAQINVCLRWVITMNELKRIRESLNLTQIEAANMLNVSRRTYQKYEALENSNDAKLS